MDWNNSILRSKTLLQRDTMFATNDYNFLTWQWTPPPLTRLVHHREGRHPPLHEDAQSFDDGRVGVDEGDVAVGPDAQLF